MYRMLVLGACLAVAGFGQSTHTAIAAKFIGSWTLVSYELRLASGTITKPFGDRPVGRILYQKSGHMSAQLMRPASAPFASNDPLEATADETDRAWRNYIGYWGTFSIDPKAGIVVHQIEGGWFPNWISRNQIRSFRFERESLVLEADSPAWHATLIW